MVKSELPTPKANLPPTSAVPKSLAVPDESPSTRPLPLYQLGVPPVCVVLTQNAMLKSLATEFVICTELLLPLKTRQPPTRPLLFQVALVTNPLLPLPEKLVAMVPFVSSS